MSSGATHSSGDGTGSLPGTAPTTPVRSSAVSPPSTTTTPQAVVPNAISPVKPAPAPAGPKIPTLQGSGGGGGGGGSDVDMSGVALGLEALERQQDAQERKRQQATAAGTAPVQQQAFPPAAQQPQQQVSPQQPRVYRDDDTDPASSLTGDSSLNTNEDKQAASSLGRFIQNTRRRLSSRDMADPTRGVHMTHHIDRDISEAEMWEASGRPLISGYLHKFSRNGKWQRRYFESDGESLSYYKTEARSKMLATLDLVKVGKIALDPSDSTECMFAIQVADRPYSLRAETKASAMDWVITLNRIKEARMQVGHVKLLPSKGAHLAPGQSDEFTPRVVVVANRQRTRAVDGEQVHSIEDMIISSSSEENQLMSLRSSDSSDKKSIQRAVVARWQKRRTTLSRLGARLVHWARSVNILKSTNSCTDVEDQVVLDHHIHPPGHDDPRLKAKGISISKSASAEVPQGPSAWIGKEAQMTGAGGPSGAHSGADEEDDMDTRQIA